jgi:response regulator RpfG family c-di-GMP phosphodiesterase
MSEGYFYIIDRRGMMVGHPFRPDLTDTDVRTLTDGTGSAFVNRLIGGRVQGPGRYETYQYNWLDGTTGAPEQLAYAAGFEPWDWFIVTEVQITDINAQIFGDLARQVGLLLMLTVVLAGVLSATLRRLVLQGVDRLIKVARELAAGNMSARAVVSPTDEVSSLARAINQMAEGIQARDERLRLTQRAAVYALAKLAEARDRETGGHLLRVREYAATLAHELSKHPNWQGIIDNGFIADLYDASLLHDVGKVAVPDSILLKPDVLDEGEMAIMMSHTLVGANTIRAARERMKAESSFLVMAEQIARSHHERWNGEGYVEGLAGSAIPPAARIFSVVDVYDALTTQRPYKRAYSHKQAVGLMREDRGKRFDPEVFDAFLAVAGRFDEIRAEFAD